MDYSAKALIRDSDGSKVFAMDDSAKTLIRDSDGSKVYAMDDFAKALIRDSDESKVFAMDTPDNGARKAPRPGLGQGTGRPRVRDYSHYFDWSDPVFRPFGV